MKIKNNKKDRFSAGNRVMSRPDSALTKPAVYYKPIKRTENVKDGIATSTRKSVTKSALLSRLVSASIILGFIFIFAYSSTLSSNVKVQVSKSNAEFREQSEYRSGVKSILESSILNKSKLFADSDAIENKVKLMFPEVESAVLIMPLGGRNPRLNITTSSIVASVDNGATTSVITESGLIIKDVILPNSPTQLRVRLLNLDITGFENGDQVLTRNEVSLIKLLRDELGKITINDKPVTPQSIDVNVIDASFMVKLKDFPFIVKMSSQSDSREEVGALLVALEWLSSDNSLPSEYIDVRVPGRVFVK